MAIGNIDLNPQLVQAVRDAVDIVAIASDHTRLHKAGRHWQGLCPLHKEKSPSFSVEPDKGLFYCFGCGVGGDAIKLHMLLSGDDFPAAIEALARRYGIPLPSRRRKEGGPDVDGALAAAARFFRDQLAASPGARAYLERRRIPPALVESFGLGYAPDSWEALLTALSPRISPAALEAAGLVGRSRRSGKLYDRFRHRLVFPISSPGGRLVGFGGRTLGDDKAKYVNTAETEHFHKSRLLFGLTQAKRVMRESGRVLLVEGYFDVIGAVAAGEEATVAGMGTSLTEQQVQLLARFCERVVVGFDDDEAGERAFRRTLPLLLSAGLAVERACFGAGHDPDSLRLEVGEDAVRQAVGEARDAVELELERLTPREAADDPRWQASAAREVVALLEPIPDAVLRYGYGRRAAQRLGLPVDMLSRQLSARPRGSRKEDSGVGPAATGAEPAVAGSSHEKRTLARLLALGGAPLPAAVVLPPDAVFFDPLCRNIYWAFRTLYNQDGGAPPDAGGLRSALRDDSRAISVLAEIDALAGDMVGETVASLTSALAAELTLLRQRSWRRRENQRLLAEIKEAEAAGDMDRARALSEEKQALSRNFHQRSTDSPGAA